MPLHVLTTCAHYQEVKIPLHSLWYHHTHRWPSRAQGERGLSVIKQIDAQNFCSTINLFNASTCTQDMWSSSGSQNCITQTLVFTHPQVAVSCTD